jgi:phosphoglycerate kinase
MPIDHIVTDKDGKYGDLDTQEIKKGFKGVDIGPKTLTVYREIIESSHSIIWNGPVGIFENEESNRGTESIGEYIALSAPKNAFKLTFGDSTSLALKQLKIKHKRFSHISVAGDAFVNYLLG